jgi:hypothetical protein
MSILHISAENKYNWINYLPVKQPITAAYQPGTIIGSQCLFLHKKPQQVPG